LNEPPTLAGRWVDAAEGLPTVSAFYVVQTRRQGVLNITAVKWRAGLSVETQSSTAWRTVQRWFSIPIPHPQEEPR
jgi:hypothetical protein